MVTASHNENGWTGVKMGAQRPLTFGPDEITRLKAIVLAGEGKPRPGGTTMSQVPDMRERYLADVTKGHKLSRPIRVLAACGNGTAGAFAPEALKRIGADVVPMDCELDCNVPALQSEPRRHEDAARHRRRRAATAAPKSPRVRRRRRPRGVVDDSGHEIFADKIGALLARDLVARTQEREIRGRREIDRHLHDRSGAEGAQASITDYWKTGHSYIKRRTAELHALAGFEKSGHYFFNPPIGRGYDEGIVAAIAILEMLDRAGGKKISALVNELPKTWGSPTMAPYCPDDKKYAVVDAMTKEYEGLKAKGEKLLGAQYCRHRHRQRRARNARRRHLGSGARVVEQAVAGGGSAKARCRTSEMRAMFADIDARLKKHPEVGEYDQKI